MSATEGHGQQGTRPIFLREFCRASWCIQGLDSFLAFLIGVGLEMGLPLSSGEPGAALSSG